MHPCADKFLTMQSLKTPLLDSVDENKELESDDVIVSQTKTKSLNSLAEHLGTSLEPTGSIDVIKKMAEFRIQRDKEKTLEYERVWDIGLSMLTGGLLFYAGVSLVFVSSDVNIKIAAGSISIIFLIIGMMGMIIWSTVDPAQMDLDKIVNSDDWKGTAFRWGCFICLFLESCTWYGVFAIPAIIVALFSVILVVPEKKLFQIRFTVKAICVLTLQGLLVSICFMYWAEQSATNGPFAYKYLLGIEVSSDYPSGPLWTVPFIVMAVYFFVEFVISVSLFVHNLRVYFRDLNNGIPQKDCKGWSPTLVAYICLYLIINREGIVQVITSATCFYLENYKEDQTCSRDKIFREFEIVFGLIFVTPPIILALLGPSKVFNWTARTFDRNEKRLKTDGCFIAELLDAVDVEKDQIWWVHHKQCSPLTQRNEYQDKAVKGDWRQNYYEGVVVETAQDYFMVQLFHEPDPKYYIPVKKFTAGRSTFPGRRSKSVDETRRSRSADAFGINGLAQAPSTGPRLDTTHRNLIRIEREFKNSGITQEDSKNAAITQEDYAKSSELLKNAAENLRCIDFLKLTAQLFTQSVRDFKDKNPKGNLFELSRALGPDEKIDFFISHAWKDDGVKKFAKICELAELFRSKHRRNPTFWFDKVCFDQEKINDGLKVLPINVMSCDKMLVLCGSDYINRLWCIWELFTLFSFMDEKEAIKRVHLCQLDEDMDFIGALKSFDVQAAHCYDPNEEAKIRFILNASGSDSGSKSDDEKSDGAEQFNTKIRRLADHIPRQVLQMSVNSTETENLVMEVEGFRRKIEEFTQKRAEAKRVKCETVWNFGASLLTGGALVYACTSLVFLSSDFWIKITAGLLATVFLVFGMIGMVVWSTVDPAQMDFEKVVSYRTIQSITVRWCSFLPLCIDAVSWYGVFAVPAFVTAFLTLILIIPEREKSFVNVSFTMKLIFSLLMQEILVVVCYIYLAEQCATDGPFAYKYLLGIEVSSDYPSGPLWTVPFTVLAVYFFVELTASLSLFVYNLRLFWADLDSGVPQQDCRGWSPTLVMYISTYLFLNREGIIQIVTSSTCFYIIYADTQDQDQQCADQQLFRIFQFVYGVLLILPPLFLGVIGPTRVFKLTANAFDKQEQTVENYGKYFYAELLRRDPDSAPSSAPGQTEAVAMSPFLSLTVDEECGECRIISGVDTALNGADTGDDSNHKDIVVEAAENLRCVDFEALMSLSDVADSSSFEASRPLRPGEKIDFFVSLTFNCAICGADVADSYCKGACDTCEGTLCAGCVKIHKQGRKLFKGHALLEYDDEGKIERKLDKIREVAEVFRAVNERYPTFWIDKVCYRQTTEGDGLRVLPIHLLSCKQMLVLHGRNYTKELSRIWELFTLVSLRGTKEAVEKIIIHKLKTGTARDNTSVGSDVADVPEGDATTVEQLASLVGDFDISKAHSADFDEQLIRTVLGKWEVSEEEFNEKVRGMFSPASLAHTESGHSGDATGTRPDSPIMAKVAAKMRTITAMSPLAL